ncbi:MAG: PAS domain-containing protein, partial [Methanothrix sp.]
MQTNKIFPADPVMRKRAEEEVRKNSRSSCLSEMDVRALCHELEVSQIELQLQNEELQRITAELTASEEKYRDLYEFAPIGYLTIEPSGQIREANLAAAAFLGTERVYLLNNLFQA